MGQAFHTDKKTSTDSAGDDKRQNRRNRREESRDQETRDEKKSSNKDDGDTGRKAVTSRNALWHRSSDHGRTAAFFNSYKEQLKQNDAEDGPSKLLQISGDITRDLSRDRGFLVYTSEIEGDVYWHLLILEASANAVRMKNARDRNRRDRGRDRDRDSNTKIITSSIDGITNALVTLIEKFLMRVHPTSGNYIFTQATIVPFEANLEDESVVSTFLAAVDDANYVTSDTDSPFDDRDVRDGAKVRGSLTCNGENRMVDKAGQPYRADFTIEVHEHVRGESENVLMSNDSGTTFVSLDCYVQPVFDGHEEDVRRLQKGERYDLAAYIPEITMSNIDLNTLEHGKYERLFMGLAMLPNMNTNDYYMRGFETNYHGDKSRALSGLAYAMDWPEDVMPDDLSKLDDDANSAMKWLNKVFKVDAGAEFSVMIKEGGLNYSILKILIDLGEGDEDAYDKLLDVLDNLTDGGFESRNPTKGPEDVVYKLVRIPYGYYKTSGEAQPSEMIDNLTVLNMSKNSLDTIDDFMSLTAGNVQGMSYDEANTRLVSIVDEVTGRQFVMKGFATKAYIDPDFLKALYDALQASNLEVDVEHDDLGDNRGRRRRGQSSGRRLLENDLGARRPRRSHDRKRDSIVSGSYRRR